MPSCSSRAVGYGDGSEVERWQFRVVYGWPEMVEVQMGMGFGASLVWEDSSRRIVREDSTEIEKLVEGPSLVAEESGALGVVGTSLWLDGPWRC